MPDRARTAAGTGRPPVGSGSRHVHRSLDPGRAGSNPTHARLLSLVLSLFVLVLPPADPVVDPQQDGVLRSIDDVVFRLTEPVLAPVRRVIPPLGGIDVSFIVVIVAIYLVRAIFLR
jgi:uncharacterized protein YggT (Ycf19 family)